MDCFDYFLLTIIIFTIVGDFIYIFSSIINHLIEYFNINGLDLINSMSDNKTTPTLNTNNSSTSNTTTTIIHDDGSWSGASINERSLFIYGSGGMRLATVKGSPGRVGFVIISTILGDATSRILTNAINDPTYVRNHYVNWKGSLMINL